ncbi:DUF3800 domain-containing protein [Spiroplasma endosymbiont of Aspidapion aeneum]|uniref:DUF3800 domain-containing protein n=1 Tax=Spiroplasma endosymbiont of Aspidapion aeneum TaxID=3066276 RepID=UPI00313EB4CE
MDIKEVYIFLDESGNPMKSSFFTVGGIIIDALINRKNIGRNIKKIENTIMKKYPNNNECKWSILESLEERKYIFENIINFGQVNISITADQKKYRKIKNNQNSPISCNLYFNYLVKILLSNYIGFNDNRNIKFYIMCDNRGISDKGLKSLEDYLNVEIKTNLNFKGEYNFIVKYKKSHDQPLIRYADYYSGMINSLFKYQSRNYDRWDEGIDDVFKIISKKVDFKCYTFYAEVPDVIRRQNFSYK